MHNDIKNENRLRKERLGELSDFLKQDTDLTNKFLDNFEKQASQEADKFMDDLDKELDNRFEHQEKVLGNMSQFVGKFQ
eukprot:CAMPEP_0176374896 /NCGR_PEP_ID=MMETSP0126-20121128/27104_1 /TAXON_ID=141414 ORGANISM="Strombidinopsis acuminatum, Strain SPMC142" /NCGR_SAMPLE_ID=MMETSP0126 /ASSEMBLY_ACC=CAM_ASM_000229 /LENGTH=78 /DNA_ID=CAMNT_0017735707 /DNA_START=505 /DNA_END=741 /DNA_ORIENTATION=-